ncbi:MAG: tail fiber protein, partial [Candidatus Pacebacteria bacterium]|nr:tail fiber protein [Candidatus Paceibacterota bacterium]
VYAAGVWHGTDWIQTGEVISAQKIKDNFDYLYGLGSGAIPVGTILSVAYSTPDTNYLECNGAEISRTTYSELFTKIGTTYGTGNGSSTFNIPDLRGEFLRGWDNGRGIDGGRNLGTFQEDELKSHDHGLGFSKTDSPYNKPSYSNSGGRVYYGNERVDSTGGIETRPRNISVMYQIKAL